MSCYTYKPEEYIRKTQIVEAYIHDCALYVSRMSGKPYAVCEQFIRENMKPGGLAPFHDPEIAMLQRQKNGDRVKKTMTLSQYWAEVDKNKLIMVPTMTVYLNPQQRKSFLALYIAENLKRRKVFKNAMLAAKVSGDKAKYDYFNNQQNSQKIKNNSVSGAHASPSTPIYNKSSHSTLTSTCRISTSYANASNEWLLGGNRHFWSPQIVLVSLILSCRHTDWVAFERAMVMYSLYIPTANDVMECIRRSADLYWRCDDSMAQIHRFVLTMTDLERAAFVYMSDLYHLAKYNDAFVREYMREMTEPVTGGIDNPDEVLKKLDGDQATLTVLLCSNIMAGRELPEVKEKDPEGYRIVGATGLHVMQTVNKYAPLIEGIFRPSILPPSIAQVPSIIRRVVVTSDTDSTIFTNQHWTMWYTNGELFTPKTYQIGYVTTYMASQCVKHKLGLMSANIGAIPEHIHRISMKNEYYFPVFCLTPAAKHYYAYRYAQEGRILKELETEIKGVQLRDSAAPAHVTKKLKKYIEFVMTQVMTKGTLGIDEILKPIAELELSIIDHVTKGGYGYAKSFQVKDHTGYSQGVDAPNYKHYTLWNTVFAPKYGPAPQPPYQAFKISVDLANRRQITNWLATMKDQVMANRLREYIVATGKKDFTSFVVPVNILDVSGVPEEILSAVDVRRLVATMVRPFYIVLESLGIYILNDDITRLVSDTYNPTVSLAA